MVMDSDTNTTRPFISLLEDVDTQYFVDSSLISDTPITNRTKDGGLIAIYKEDDYIVLDYIFDGTGSVKSCTKKVKLEFATHILAKLNELQQDEPTTLIEDMIEYRQLCMVATVYNLKRDKVDFNQVKEVEQYYVCYFLRKNKQNRYYLQSELKLAKLPKFNNLQVNELSLFFDIKPTFQRQLGNKTSLLEELKELEELEEFQDLFDDEYEDEDYDEEIDDFENIENDDFSL